MTFPSQPTSTAILSPPSLSHTSRWELYFPSLLPNWRNILVLLTPGTNHIFCPFVSFQRTDFPAPGHPLQQPLTRLEAEYRESALEINKLVRDVFFDHGLMEDQMGIRQS